METRINHVSINARDLSESVDFYTDLLGAEPIPTPNFGLGNHLVLLPGDLVQLYVRDPSGNLVELDQAGSDRLPADMRARLNSLSDFHPQSEQNLRGRLFVSA